MNRIIFDIHIDIDDDKLDTDLGSYAWDTIPRAERSKIAYNDYHDRLTENKRDYAEKIGVDYKHYSMDQEWIDFFNDMHSKYPHLSVYLIVNFYKLHLMEKLSEEYDQVLYCDFDVIFMTDENYFEQFEDDGIYLSATDCEDDAFSFMHYNPHDRLHLRSQLNKYFIAYALCDAMDFFYDYPVTNTGLILSSAKWIKQLNFMGQLDNMIALIDTMMDKNDSPLPDNIKTTLDWNNEPFYSVAAQRAEVPLIDSAGPWNFVVNMTMSQEAFDSADKKVVHMILKRFDWIWRD